jgi:hypothetical protein
MWARIATALLGVWLMIAPALLGFGKKISDNDHIVGPLIATFSIIAIFECTRNVKMLNLPLVLWLFLAPWILDYDNDTALFDDYAVALAVLLLSFVKQKRENRFGGGWPAIWKDNTLHAREAAREDRLRPKF